MMPAGNIFTLRARDRGAATRASEMSPRRHEGRKKKRKRFNPQIAQISQIRAAPSTPVDLSELWMSLCLFFVSSCLRGSISSTKKFARGSDLIVEEIRHLLLAFRL